MPERSRRKCVAVSYTHLDVYKRQVCGCQAGYTGDPRLGCVPLQYCKSDSQCPSGTMCSNGICLCKYKFDISSYTEMK